MAVVRRFGPTKGAGVVIVEKPPEEAMRPAALGVACLVGQFEKGTVSTLANPKLNRCATKRTFTAKMGSRVSFSTAPDCADDYFSLGNGNGQLICIRLTDGTDQTAGGDFMMRARHTGFFGDQEGANSGGPCLTLQAANSGSWGGSFRHLSGTLSASSAVTATALTTGTTMIVNEFAGAKLVLEGVPGEVFHVLGNTATALTLDSASGIKDKLDSAIAADAATSLDFHVQLTPKVLDSGKKKGVRVQFGPAQEAATAAGQVGGNFSMSVFVDDDLVREYPTLSLHSESKFFIDDQLNKDTSNFHLRATSLIATGEAVSTKKRPANYYAMVHTATASTVKVCPLVVESATHENQVVGAYAAPTSISGLDVALPPSKMTFTFASSGNTYTVTGGEYSQDGVHYDDLGTLAMGGSGAQTATFTPPYAGLPSVTIDHLGTVDDGSVIEVAYHPIPAEAVGHSVVPDAVGNQFKTFKIASVNAAGDTVTVESGNPSTDVTHGTDATSTTSAGPSAEATITGSGGETIVLSIDGRRLLAVSLSAGDKKVSEIADAINTAFNSSVFYGADYNAVASKVVEGGQDRLKITSPGGLCRAGGKGSIVRVFGTSGSTSSNTATALGLGTDGTQDAGTDGSEVELRFPSLLGDGFDGGAVADSSFVEALSTTDTPLLQLREAGLGVVQIATPGITSTTVQKQGILCAESLNYMYHVLVPSATTDEAAAVNYINDTIGRSDFGCSFFPSFVDIADPDADGSTKEIPITGMVLGRDALFANAFGGYHRPAAGLDATLPRVVDLPTGDSRLNEELLTPAGLNVIKKKLGNFVIYGGRTIGKTTAFQFRTHRLQLSHYEHTFLDSFDFVIFALNNTETRAQLISIFNGFFQQEFAKGVVVGTDLQDAVKIKIDDDNNPAVSVAQGDLNAEVMIRLVNFVERFIITVGKQGIFESQG